MDLLTSLGELIFPTPRICPFCFTKQESLMVCATCRTNLADYKDKLKQCTRCGTFGKPGGICDNCRDWPRYLKRNFAAVPYEKQYRDALHNFKFKKQGWLTPALVDLMLAHLSQIEINLILPIPLHKNRQKERGFNQALLLAKEMAKRLQLECDSHLLTRIVDTPHQTGLTKNQRRTNLTKAFAVNNHKKIQGKTILLVDDVITTGITIRECAKTLYKEGAKLIYGVTLAAGIK